MGNRYYQFDWTIPHAVQVETIVQLLRISTEHGCIPKLSRFPSENALGLYIAEIVFEGSTTSSMDECVRQLEQNGIILTNFREVTAEAYVGDDLNVPPQYMIAFVHELQRMGVINKFIFDQDRKV